MNNYREPLASAEEYYREMANDYRKKYIKLEQEHVLFLEDAQIKSKAARTDIEETFGKKVQRLEYLNEK